MPPSRQKRRLQIIIFLLSLLMTCLATEAAGNDGYYLQRGGTISSSNMCNEFRCKFLHLTVETARRVAVLRNENLEQKFSCKDGARTCSRQGDGAYARGFHSPPTDAPESWNGSRAIALICRNAEGRRRAWMAGVGSGH